MGFSSRARGKELTCQRRRLREETWIPGSGRSPAGGHSSPLQSPCLEKPTDRGAWRAVVQSPECLTQLKDVVRTRVRLGPNLLTMTEQLTFHFSRDLISSFFSLFLEYNCLTMLCEFPLYSTANQLRVQKPPLSGISLPAPQPAHHRAPS